MTSVEFSLEVNSLFSFEFDTVYGEITFFLTATKKYPPKKRVATYGLNEKSRWTSTRQMALRRLVKHEDAKRRPGLDAGLVSKKNI